MDNKDRNQLVMEKKCSNSYIRADKELDKILSKQRQRFFSSICKTLKYKSEPQIANAWNL
jgi:hypothetical protein